MTAAKYFYRNPIGPNVRQNADLSKLETHARRAGGFKAMLFQTLNPEIMHQFKGLADNLIWRHHGDETLFMDHASPELWVDQAMTTLVSRGFDPGEVWVHLHNEPGWGQDMIEWERRAVLHGIKKGMRFICFNMSIGTPEPNLIHWALPVLNLANEYPEQVMIGLHEYKSVFWQRGLGWYLGRFQKWVQFCQDRGLRVRIGLTEFGSDLIHDDMRWLREQVGDQADRMKGWQTLEPVFRKHVNPYPGLQEFEGKDLTDAWDNVYANSWVEWALHFSWGDWGSSPERPWYNFDYTNAGTLQSVIENWWKEKNHMPPAPPEEEKKWVHVLLRGNTVVNIRQRGTTDSPDIGNLVPGEHIEIIPAETEWIRVRKNGLEGWAYRGLLSWTEVKPNPPGPEPDPEPPVPIPPITMPPDLMEDTLTEAERKMIDYAIQYAEDASFPTIGANEKKLIARLHDIIAEWEEWHSANVG